MRFSYLLAPIIFALSPLSLAVDEHEHEHEQSLSAHLHGVATLNIALDDQELELQLNSPAMNIVGFEYKPSSAADKHALLAAERALKNEQDLFKLTPAAQCALSAMTIDNDLADQHQDDDQHSEHDKHPDEHPHADIQARYLFNCTTPDKLSSINLAGFFSAFPQTEKLTVQLITPDAQHGVELSPSNPVLSW